MTRSGFRRLWLLVLIILLISSYMVYNKTTNKQFEIDNVMRVKDSLVLERESSKSMASRLQKVDELTLHEPDTTRLDILRFLGIEEDNIFEYEPTTRLVQTAGGIEIYERTFMLKAELPYTVAMRQIDKLYANEKVTLLQVSMKHQNVPGHIVNVEVEAKIYALDKGSSYSANMIRRKR